MTQNRSTFNQLAFYDHSLADVMEWGAECPVTGSTTRAAEISAAKSSARGQCDTLGCVVRTRGQIIAFVKDVAALPDDCGVATIVISRVPVRKKRCVGPDLIIDRFDLWRAGAHALWLNPEGIQVKTVAGTNSRRPWSRYPRRRRQL